MEIKWLQDFISLANTGSFSKAAENRHVTQSAFSRRIQALEEWLGTTLVDRHTHPVTLTESGIRFVDIANQTILRLYRAKEGLGTRNNGRLPTMTIGVACHLSVHFVPDWLREIKPLLGDRKIQILTDLRAGINSVELLKMQELDFFLAYGHSVNHIDHDSSLFDSLVLDEDVLMPVCRTSLLADSTFTLPATPGSPLPFVGYMPTSSMTSIISRFISRSTKPVCLKTNIETPSAETIKALVLGGAGMGWIPRRAVADELSSGELSEMGDGQYQIPFSIELFRYVPNTKPEIIMLWDKLNPNA
jgi:DNA-binding transcriptional LysR family regulator